MEKLAVLQALDIKIRGMQREKDEIPTRLAALEGEFKKEEEKVLGQKAELDRLLKDRRHKEKELEEEVERAKKTEARAFEIKTNKEYQAVLKEIEGAKKLNRQREEEILGILERFEELQKVARQGEKELEAKQKDYQQQLSELQQRAAQFEQKMAAEVKERDERQKGIPPDLLSKYQMLLERRQGIAVAPVSNGVCKACNMNLRPQLYIELQKQQTLILCPNCSRILFWENGAEKAKQP
ncbi:MAG: C4-type zinc ribbon domain-containing protein [Deltaproteobacteria bacterium]|nr:C4-type zinc ribbon domain-containing protein [Deltaproteobacteria bacterium]